MITEGEAAWKATFLNSHRQSTIMILFNAGLLDGALSRQFSPINIAQPDSVLSCEIFNCVCCPETKPDSVSIVGFPKIFADLSIQ